MRTYLLLLMLFMFTGCAHTDQLIIPDGQMLVKKVRVDPKLLVDCQKELAALKGNSLEDVLAALADSKVIHDECWKRTHELIELWKVTFPPETAASAASGVSK